ncbi:hypothetical protein I79_020286 [Cricetulus griseus]|uniref:Uncharacterized protein n=1 Tax=Cricetulus griseus TaxID=10029 RepID=G3I9N2_CRIGR|nr:hypothetical protein I79_020286 [Cricetulus griseus]
MWEHLACSTLVVFLASKLYSKDHCSAGSIGNNTVSSTLGLTGGAQGQPKSSPVSAILISSNTAPAAYKVATAMNT